MTNIHTSMSASDRCSRSLRKVFRQTSLMRVSPENVRKVDAIVFLMLISWCASDCAAVRFETFRI
ncbi:uncharacterized protein C8R40DRAFT_479288 [Lentinula edodes]|uniref:uncharacterized protein n=1 Tax=Lentinula edodes TaxID=5353 RepID=UPI001E8D8C8A|nr:uncharacterized protein C8R40DRAFT_479288 [Lentinula edodes]KAH7872661.1 hypothetical protein C8R40DRAFT_479288 [Lentinula edodes]